MDLQPPPQSAEMEQAVVACLLLGMQGAKLVMTRMDPEWFYCEKNRVISSVLGKYIESGVEPDLPLACQWLTAAGVLGEVGGQAYLVDCMDKCGHTYQVEHYINELKKLYFDRKILAAVYKVNADPSAENIEELRLRSQDRDCVDAKGVINVADCMGKIVEMTQPLTHGIYDIFGMPKMDEHFNATKPGEILTIGARPGIGKTVIATHIGINFCKKYMEPVLYYSTEMAHEETIARVMSPLSRVPGWKFRKRYFDKEGKDVIAIGEAANELVKLPFYMVDRSNPIIADIRAGMIATKCRLVIIDYFQHLEFEVGHEGLPAAMERAMQRIKTTCRDLNAICIILSQLDRGVDALTARQRPQLKDLKGSGSIEQESDAVIFLHEHDKKDPDSGLETVGDIPGWVPIEAIHAKNRHGKRDVSVQLVFDEKFIEFLEWNTELDMKLSPGRRAKVKKAKKNDTKAEWGKDSLAKGGSFTPDPDAGEQF